MFYFDWELSRQHHLQETRAQIFKDYVDSGRDTMKVEAHFEARLEEKTRTQIRYGFRNEMWLQKHHGERKATKIMNRKKELGLNLVSITSGLMFFLFIF